MDWAYKAASTAIAVALLLTVARMCGRRVAGLLAGLPTVTGPALLWLALDFGPGFAARAATGSVAACALCALFALGHERASRRVGPLATIAAAIATGAILAAPAHALRFELAAVCFLAVAACLGGLALLPRGRELQRKLLRASHGEVRLIACAAGLVAALASIAAPHVGAFWAGMLASPPLVAAAIAVHLHVVHGRPSTHAFLRCYVGGLLGRALFGAVFSLAIGTIGMAAGVLAATAAGCLVTCVVIRAMNMPASSAEQTAAEYPR